MRIADVHFVNHLLHLILSLFWISEFNQFIKTPFMALCVFDLYVLKFSRLLSKSKAEILLRSAEKKKKNYICFLL